MRIITAMRMSSRMILLKKIAITKKTMMTRKVMTHTLENPSTRRIMMRKKMRKLNGLNN